MQTHNSASTETDIEIGIPKDKREEIVTGLSRVLADSSILYLKSRSFHWNVTGPLFQTLHTMFEEQYTELEGAIDDIAERIRALGFPAPGSFAQYQELSSIREEPGTPLAEEMIRQLVRGHETVANTARKVFPAAENASDESTVDLLVERMRVHEKTAWMLRSLLENRS